MRGAVSGPAHFLRATDGVSAVEFALIFPILLILLLAGGQVILYVDAARKVQQIATSVSEMLSQATPTYPATVAQVTATNLNFGYDASMVIFPYMMGDAKRRSIGWRQAITVSFAGINFQKLSASCDGAADQSSCYAATVGWTSTGTSQAQYRPCLTPQLPVDDNARTSRFTLPRSLFGQGSIIAVDVTYTFNPTFGSGLVPPVTITRSAFVQPRYATRIDFDATNNDGIASICIVPPAS